MIYFPKGINSDDLIVVLKSICLEISLLFKTYTTSHSNLSEFREKLNIKVVKNELVTEVDLKVNEIIKNGIKESFPNADWEFLSEEDNKIIKKSNFKSDFVWIIDPLDGTNGFINGSGEYAIHIALTYKKKVIFSVVMIPHKEEIWIYEERKSSWCEDLLGRKKIFRQKNKKINEIIIIKSKSHSHAQLDDLIMQLNPKNIIEAGSIGFKITSIIRGDADLYISYSLPNKSCPKDWDMAAPEGIIRGFGGFLTDLDGNDLLFLNDNDFKQGGIIVGSYNLNHSNICKNIRDIIKSMQVS